MSYHFQRQADSSDDEQEQVDISAWQGAASGKPKSPAKRAPVVPMMGGTEQEADQAIADFMHATNGTNGGAVDALEDEEESVQLDNDLEVAHNAKDNDSDGIGVVQVRTVSPKPTRGGRPRRANRTVGFTPINKQVSSTARGDSEDASIFKPTQRKVIPVIPRLEVDANERVEFEDYTAGGDTVRRIIRQLKRRDGAAIYRVEFEDWHAEDVSSAPSLLLCRCCTVSPLLCRSMSQLVAPSFTEAFI